MRPDAIFEACAISAGYGKYVMGGGQCVTDGSSEDMASWPDFVESFLGGIPAAHR